MKKESIREKIISSAFELFAVEGYSVGIQSIITKAGISRGALYYYFKSKEELFEVVIRQYLFDHFDGFSQIVSSDEDFKIKIEKIIEMSLHPFHAMEKYTSHTKKSGYLSILTSIRQNKRLAQLQDKYEDAWNKSVRKIAKQGIDEGRLHADTDVYELVNLFRLMIDGTLATAYNTSLEEARFKLKRSVAYILT